VAIIQLVIDCEMAFVLEKESGRSLARVDRQLVKIVWELNLFPRRVRIAELLATTDLIAAMVHLRALDILDTFSIQRRSHFVRLTNVVLAVEVKEGHWKVWNCDRYLTRSCRVLRVHKGELELELTSGERTNRNDVWSDLAIVFGNKGLARCADKTFLDVVRVVFVATTNIRDDEINRSSTQHHDPLIHDPRHVAVLVGRPA